MSDSLVSWNTPRTDAQVPTSGADPTATVAQSTRVLALLGPGLSASSGLPTFRSAGGIWHTYDATSLATPKAFKADPALV
ncbi:hypothetical protein LTR08_007559 [Meristemomyces frigidus]|nr:hypothetical protein LTR08_007559 [Meristemomyces frigidus]